MNTLADTKKPINIKRKIVGYSIANAANDTEEKLPPTLDKKRFEMEDIRRPDQLRGSTYKVQSPVLESALYITINDILIEGDGDPYYRPFEVFINSKDMSHFQWIVALTRVMSAVFRKGGDVTFLVEELGSVFEPSGGYFKKGGKFVPSIVAEIGEVLKTHLTTLGMIKSELSPEQAAFISEKRASMDSGTESSSEYPANATLCKKCNTKAVVMSGGCDTCLSCGNSKCQ